LRTEEERDADEEEDVAHGQQGAVEEQDQAEDEEEAAAAAEGDADFWDIFVSILCGLGEDCFFDWTVGTYSASRRATLSAWWARGVGGRRCARVR
jgi:hypothetical protein